MAAIVNSMRVTHRYLQTPIRGYRHPHGRTVWLVGLIHNGERRYYQQLRGAVAALEDSGAVVHYESTSMTKEKLEAAAPSEPEQEAYQLTLDTEEGHADIFGPWGWVTQPDGFDACIPDSWQPHDLTLVEIIRLRGVEDTLAELRWNRILLDRAGRSWWDRKRYTVMMATNFHLIAMGIRPPRPSDTVILDRRNDKAITDACAEPGDVVLLWGCGHLDGLEDRLRDRGYTMIEETWHTVGGLPHLTILLGWGVICALAKILHLPRVWRLIRENHVRNRPYYTEVRKELADKKAARKQKAAAR